MIGNQEELPVEALPAAWSATNAAIDLGHGPRVAAWRKLSRRMFATTCQECGKTTWIAKEQDGWRMGGAATFEGCSSRAARES